MSFVVGEKLGPYEILAPIGKGGMGEVWKARDTRLDRTVAVKHLADQHSARFEQEARAVAGLNHPHICQIYDVGPDYLVLEYIEGRPLKGPLSADDAVRLALEITGALEEAHGRGILHRDLKPANILVNDKGSAKLLDFGIAKVSSETDDTSGTLTLDGTVMGTPSYMSPEQAQGQRIDVRSDIFSFGAVLYEMLSGRLAFSGGSTLEILNAVVRGEPRQLDAPPGLARIVTQCLRKAPADRFQTVGDLRTALEKATTRLVERQPSIAVLPFVNMSSDPEQDYFSDGLAEEIINALTHVRDLKVIARTSAFAFKGQNQDIRKVAEALGVANVLEGSVRKAGNRIRVTAQLITAVDGSHLFSERFDRELTDIFAVQDEIAAAIAGKLKLKLADAAHSQRVHTPDLEAYEEFLKGRHHLFQGTPDALARCKECFNRAIELDPQFAEPHAELGSHYLIIGAWGLRSAHQLMPLAREEAEKAVALSPAEPRAHAVLAWVAAFYEYNWEEAEEHFQVAMAAEAIPDEVHARHAIYLVYRGRLPEAISAMERVLRQDPLSILWRSILAVFLNTDERYDHAIVEVRKALEIDEAHWLPQFVLAQCYAGQGKFTEARELAEKSHRLANWNSIVVGFLAGIYARTGSPERVPKLLANLAPGGMVLYHALCEDLDSAADWFLKAIEQREALGVLVAGVMKLLRFSPRWPALAKRMNLPEA